MTKREIKKVLENHKHWLLNDCDGWMFMKAKLFGENLLSADLRYANLQSADLRYANLRNADLRYANLLDANLVGAKNIPFLPMACPDFGAFIGWKKARDGRIVQLEIPADARRSSATGRKCRCDKAKVIAITCWNGNAVDMAVSGYDHTFLYRVGETVTVDNFCEDRWEECAPGIHFFINRQEAVDYEN